MGHRRGQLDMAHAVAAHLLHRDFDAAFLADDALVLHALVLAAQAFVVLHRPEDAGAEQPVPLRLEGAVVDGLRLLDLAVAPAQDLIRAGQRNLDPVEGGNFLAVLEDVHQFLIHVLSLLAWRKLVANRHFASGRLSTDISSFTSSTFRPSERISLTSTLKLSGMPASNVSSPRTMAS